MNEASNPTYMTPGPGDGAKKTVRRTGLDLFERGHWIFTGDGCFMCSECNQKVSTQLAELINFCPNCGAEMKILFGGVVPLDNAKLEDADFSLADRIREDSEG